MALPVGPQFDCCLPGYSYDSGTDKCVANADPTIITDPLACACCPPGYSYIDENGEYMTQDLYRVPITNPAKSPFFNTCAQIVNSGWAMTAPVRVDPIACPCCPPGYTYWSDNNVCIENANHKHFIEPIPCIPCICTPNPAPPPPCVGCNLQNVPHPSYEIDSRFFNKKLCKDCDKVGAPVPLPGCYGNFMAIQLQDPIINFKLYV